LESICARLKDLSVDILDKDLMVHILNGLPPEYKVQVSKLEERFGSTTNLLTIQDMQNKLNLKYAQLKRMNADKIETDQALAAFRRYKGKCSNCSKFRHKMADCRSKTVSQKKEEHGESKKNKKEKKMEHDTSNILCFNCGEMGHFQLKCPKAKSKKGTRKQTDKEADTVLATIEREEWPHQDIWVANSAASTHITNSEASMFNVKNICEPVNIGDGTLVYTTKVGKLWMEYLKNSRE